MPTTVDLKLGLNLRIGSVPVALAAEVNTGPAETTYTFSGCVQQAEVPLGRFIGFVGEQFALAVELPPELNLGAAIDYIAGQVIYSKQTGGGSQNELGVAGKFTLTLEQHKYALQFYADVKIKTPAPPSGNAYVVGAAIETDLAFESLPLIGQIPGFKDLTLTNVGFSYTNADPAHNNGKPVEFNIPNVAKSSNPLYTGSNPDAKDAFDYNITSDGPKRNFALQKKGFSLTAGLVNKSTGNTTNSFALPMALPAAAPPAPGAPANFAPGATSPPASSVHWIEINKTFGPVDLKQIGLNYSQGEATFGFSAGFALGGFGLVLEGLTITFPLPLPGQPAGRTISFGLDGLGMSVQRGSFELQGIFLRVIEQQITSYYGEVAVKVGSFGLKALGGYTPAEKSFFLYASVQAPLGGPPFLFLTGLAGGFGINRALNLPTIDELPGFILMPGVAPAPESSPSKTIAKILPQIKKYLAAKDGQYWIAAGITFTSFQMIDAAVLLTVAFGVDFQIAVLGRCSMSFPKLGPALAFIQVDLLASFTPSIGLLAVDGRLSAASFIYGGFMRLTGGFAFYVWFGATQPGIEDHRGEFVVSVGGYHPAFIKPKYYPAVPRLGISAGLGPLQITGGAYFALTPAQMMAGISMVATWSSGPIKAWFAAGVDFLIAWAPFHYEAGAYVSIGCSVDLGLFTLTVHVGAGLQIWGPEFGGTATVDLDVVSFTIRFGEPNKAPAPLDWNGFRQSFLPPNTTPKASAVAGFADPPPIVNIIKASVSKGYLGSYDDDKWLIDPNAFMIETNSTIPSNFGHWTTETGFDNISNSVSDYGKKDPDGLFLALPAKTFSNELVWNPAIDIGPMNQKGVKSYHTITLTRSGKQVADVSVMPRLLDSNAALWTAAKKDKQANDPPLTKGTLAGFSITPIPQNPGQVANVPLKALLFSQGSSTGFSYTAAAVNPDFTVHWSIGPLPEQELKITISGAHSGTTTSKEMALGEALDSSWVNGQRQSLLAELAAGFGTYQPAQTSVTEMAREALMNWPVVQMLGANQ